MDVPEKSGREETQKLENKKSGSDGWPRRAKLRAKIMINADFNGDLNRGTILECFFKGSDWM